MKLPEQKMWDRLERVMRGYWLADRVENGKSVRGMPDVYFTLPKECVAGWIELKVISAWPKKRETPVAVRHFTPEQKRWLSTRHRAGGNCWFLLHVMATNEYIFVPGDRAPAVGDLTRTEIYVNSVAHFHGIPRAETVKSILATGGML